MDNKSKEKDKKTINMGSLLRLFKSEFFDSYILVSYLFKYQQAGVHDYLCNELYKLTDTDVEFYLPQLCNLLINCEFQTDSLQRYMLDKCSQSMHLALEISWILQAYIEDNNPETQKRCIKLKEDIEISIVNSKRPDPYLANSSYTATSIETLSPTMGQSAKIDKNPPQNKKEIKKEEDKKVEKKGEEIQKENPEKIEEGKRELKEEKSTNESEEKGTNESEEKSTKESEEKGTKESEEKSTKESEEKGTKESEEKSTKESEESINFALAKRERSIYFNQICQFIETLKNISDVLRSFPRENRQSILKEKLEEVNKNLQVGLYVPLFQASSTHYSVIRFDDGITLNSKDRVPILLYMEVLTHPLSYSCSHSPNLHLFKDSVYFPLLHHPLLSRSLDSLENNNNNSNNNNNNNNNSQGNNSSNTNSPLSMSQQHSFDSFSSDIFSNLKNSSPSVFSLKNNDNNTTNTTSTNTNTNKKEENNNINNNLKNSSDGESNGEVNSKVVNNLNESNENNSNSNSPSFSLKNNDNNDNTNNGNEEQEKQQQEGIGVGGETDKIVTAQNDKTNINELPPNIQDLFKKANPNTTSTYDQKLKSESETWEARKQRMRKKSMYGNVENWDMLSLIVKYGDDCRQETLAYQLIRQFQKIMIDSKLPLFYRPIDILIISSNSAIIETIPDVMSIHQLKQRNPKNNTIYKFFLQTYGSPHSQNFKIAQRNFIESLAGYTIATYILQVKDRHNGNILLDKDGHLIHIDFGFMLGTNPGNINFESSPFKFISEYVEVMGGMNSKSFSYYKALLIRGFMEVRKYMEKIVLLVEMMITGNTKQTISCLLQPNVIDNLRERFNIGKTEKDVVDFVEKLIEKSLDNPTTIWYDKFQYYTNNILY
eukprot:TRINITY_DN2721_c1_g1_i1.p1 TRINITY_DN2721_c1_g1~~TRINITY_DN2721_c1_g1_i1.p1  ORF type:complete len:884 (+),score=279.68 TRINITY_DN2721_c1_g1_i1:127-2778(+)